MLHEILNQANLIMSRLIKPCIYSRTLFLQKCTKEGQNCIFERTVCARAFAHNQKITSLADMPICKANLIISCFFVPFFLSTRLFS